MNKPEDEPLDIYNRRVEQGRIMMMPRGTRFECRNRNLHESNGKGWTIADPPVWNWDICDYRPVPAKRLVLRPLSEVVKWAEQERSYFISDHELIIRLSGANFPILDLFKLQGSTREQIDKAGFASNEMPPEWFVEASSDDDKETEDAKHRK